MTITQKTGIDLGAAKIGIIGLGAAGFGIAHLLKAYGVREIYGCDLKQEALDRLKNSGGKPVDLTTLMKEAEVIVATTGVPGLIKKEMVRKGQVILALSNPDPEIDPELAIKCGADFAADGENYQQRSGIPRLVPRRPQNWRYSLYRRHEIAAAHAIAGQTKLDSLVPSILDREVHQAVAEAVAQAWLDEQK